MSSRYYKTNGSAMAEAFARHKVVIAETDGKISASSNAPMVVALPSHVFEKTPSKLNMMQSLRSLDTKTLHQMSGLIPKCPGYVRWLEDNAKDVLTLCRTVKRSVMRSTGSKSKDLQEVKKIIRSSSEQSLESDVSEVPIAIPEPPSQMSSMVLYKPCTLCFLLCPQILHDPCMLEAWNAGKVQPYVYIPQTALALGGSYLVCNRIFVNQGFSCRHRNVALGT